jgi:hypothetical protein
MIVKEAVANLKHFVKGTRAKFHSAQQSLREMTVCVNEVEGLRETELEFYIALLRNVIGYGSKN